MFHVSEPRLNIRKVTSWFLFLNIIGLYKLNFAQTEVKSVSHVWLFVTPGTVAYKAPLSMEFSRQEYRSGLPFPSPRAAKPSSIFCADRTWMFLWEEVFLLKNCFKTTTLEQWCSWFFELCILSSKKNIFDHTFQYKRIYLLYMYYFTNICTFKNRPKLVTFIKMWLSRGYRSGSSCLPAIVLALHSGDHS